MQFSLGDPEDDSSYRSTDGSVEYTIIEKSMFEEFQRQKRLDVIFHENAIPGLTIVPDDWEEGANIVLDSILLLQIRSPLMGHDVTRMWNIPSTNKSAIKLGVRIIRLLEQIHDLGIVHGEISPHIIFSDWGADEWHEIVLANTGWGRMYVSDDGLLLSQSSTDCRTGGIIVADLSPAQLAGFCPGRYDDLYRLSETLLWLIKGDKKEFRTGSPDLLKEIKRNWTVDSAPQVLNDFKADMFNRSEKLDPSRPDYEGWIRKFELSLLQHG